MSHYISKRKPATTSRAAAADLLSRHSNTIGKDADSFLADVKIDSDLAFSDLDSRVSHRKIIMLYENLNNCSDNAILGYKMGQDMNVGDWGVVGHLMNSSATLRDSLLYLVRFMNVMSEDASVSFYEDGKEAFFRIENRIDFMHIHLTWQLFASSVLRFISLLSKSQVQPKWMTYPLGSILSTRELSILYGIDVYCINHGITFCFTRRDLLKPLQKADPYLESIFVQQAQIQLDTLNQSMDMIHRVKTHLINDLSGGQLSFTQVAENLEMSERSLQRQLTEEGTTFSQILDQFRSKNSGVLLKNPSLSISDIAKLLGYQNTNSFHRAFKRWHGVSPLHYRDVHNIK